MNNLTKYVNFRNKRINKNDIKNIFKKAKLSHFKINDITTYQKAFVHKSYIIRDNSVQSFNTRYGLKNDQVEPQTKSYDTYEFYGDSIVAISTVEYLFERYTDFNEGELTKLKNMIVSSEYLANFSRYYNLGKFVLISNLVENMFGRNTNNILEDIFEAFVASIAIDVGFLEAKQFVKNTIDILVDFSKLLFVNTNYKDRILNFFQIKGWRYPKYKIIMELGPQNKKTFVVQLLINYYNQKRGKNVIKTICSGVGKNKKLAEMNASYNALGIYNMLKKEETNYNN